jgi:hypothetical protein
MLLDNFPLMLEMIYMSAMANILIKDDANPLVEYTLVPITNSRPKWRAQVAGVPVDGQVTVEQVANVKLADGNYRRVLKLEVPVMETLGASGTSAGYVAPPKVAYVTPYTITTVVNQRSTTADMANALKFVLGLLGGASATTATGTLNGTSAADAVKNGTGPITRFMVYGEDAT